MIQFYVECSADDVKVAQSNFRKNQTGKSMFMITQTYDGSAFRNRFLTANEFNIHFPMIQVADMDTFALQTRDRYVDMMNSRELYVPKALMRLDDSQCSVKNFKSTEMIPIGMIISINSKVIYKSL